MSEDSKTKKALILDTAREIKVEKWTPAEIDQLRRRLLAEHGEAGKTGSDYIAEVLKDAGHRVLLTLQEEAEEQYEEDREDAHGCLQIGGRSIQVHIPIRRLPAGCSGWPGRRRIRYPGIPRGYGEEPQQEVHLPEANH